MPTFNQAAFLRRALISLFAQSHANWELLVVDDGSSDDTPTVLAECSADPRIRSWRLEENGGFGRVLNLAMSHAKGPYIAYLPSDDIYYPHHLASLLACFVADQAAFLAYAGMRCHQRRTKLGQIPGLALQLVQVTRGNRDHSRRDHEKRTGTVRSRGVVVEDYGEGIRDGVGPRYSNTLKTRGVR